MQNALILIGMALLLTACESVKSTLGMDHYQADEFNIRQNDPLEVPPNYKLMPPRSKDKDGKSVALNPSAEKAKQVIGGGESKAGLSEASQQALKDKVGSGDDSIREKIDQEAEAEGDSTLDKKLSAWKKEFSQNAKSINQEKTTAQERPVEKLKDQLKNESSEHHESLEERVESDMRQNAVEQERKGVIDADRIEELRENR